ncbi:MAG TPA: hypothetical protein VH207_13580 [Chthoniobacterales bacterium]|jgi:hypothetical protein|nr:hypothetical protein [Chthoniobacterales bacterium]
MRKLKVLLAVIATGLAMTALTGQQAQGSMINGAITFAGGAVYDTTSLATATRVNTFSDVLVMSRDGDFSGFVNVGDSVTMAMPWIFSPSTPTPALWSVGGFTYDLASSMVVLQNSDFLIISGTGTISGNGFDPTEMTWRFTSQEPDANGVFSFSASGGTNGVPETGATVALLGIALVGTELLRRRLLAS